MRTGRSEAFELSVLLPEVANWMVELAEKKRGWTVRFTLVVGKRKTEYALQTFGVLVMLIGRGVHARHGWECFRLASICEFLERALVKVDLNLECVRILRKGFACLHGLASDAKGAEAVENRLFEAAHFCEGRVNVKRATVAIG